MATLSEQELREDLRMRMGDRKRLISYMCLLEELERSRSGSGKLLKAPKKSKSDIYRLRSNK